MAEYKSKQRTERKHDEEEPEAAGAAPQDTKLTDDIDDLLDEIDEVLEENAEEFVRGYQQKGGE